MGKLFDLWPQWVKNERESLVQERMDGMFWWPTSQEENISCDYCNTRTFMFIKMNQSKAARRIAALLLIEVTLETADY